MEAHGGRPARVVRIASVDAFALVRDVLGHRMIGGCLSWNAVADYCVRSVAETLAAEVETQKKREATAREYALLIELAEARSELIRLQNGG